MELIRKDLIGILANFRILKEISFSGEEFRNAVYVLHSVSSYSEATASHFPRNFPLKAALSSDKVAPRMKFRNGPLRGTG